MTTTPTTPNTTPAASTPAYTPWYNAPEAVTYRYDKVRARYVLVDIPKPGRDERILQLLDSWQAAFDLAAALNGGALDYCHCFEQCGGFIPAGSGEMCETCKNNVRERAAAGGAHA